MIDSESIVQNKGPILFLLPYPSLSGLELFCLRFAKDLSSRKISVAIASPAGSLIDERCRQMDLPSLDLKSFKRFDPREVIRLMSLIETEKPIAVVAFRTHLLYTLHLAQLITRRHIPTFLFYRLGVGQQPRKDPFHRVLFKHVAAVVPNAWHLASNIKHLWAIDPSKVVCIRSGIDTAKYRPDEMRRNAFRASLGIPKDALLVGNAGRIHPEKGAEILLNALLGHNGAAAQLENVHLAYVGREYEPGYSDKLRALAAKYGAGHRFHIVPFRNDVENVYPGFDLFALAVTSRETYAYTVLEAMTCGVPVVVPAVGGLPEMFDDGVEGFFFRHRDVESLRQVLAKALALDSSVRLKMGSAARKRIMATSDWNMMMQKYIELFKNCKVDLP